MDDQLRAMLRDKADEMRLSPQMPLGLRRRSRNRRAMTAALSSVVIIAVSVGGFAGLRAALDDELSGNPVVPANPGDPHEGEVVRPITWIYPEKPGEVQERVDQGQDQQWLDPRE